MLATGALFAAGCGGDDDSDDAASAATAAPARKPAECPDGDSVLMAMPYEANQPAGENWRLGVEMAVAEINDDGGILGCQIELDPQDTQGDPDVSRQVVADQVEDDPFVFLGTVFSASTIVNMVEAQRAEIPMFVGAEAPSITDREENGDNDYIYRSSFGVDTAADKFVSFMVEQGVESVDIIYKNDEFGAGGREAYVAAFEEAGIDVGLDIQVQPDQVDQSAEVTQLAGGDADAIFVFMTEIETAAFLDEYQAQGLDKPLYGGDVLSAASTIALVQPGAADGTSTHAGLNASAPVFADWKDGLRRVPPDGRPARPQQHQGLHDRPRGQGGRRADRRVRQHPDLGHAALRHAHRRGRARPAPRRQLRRQRRHRPRELHRRRSSTAPARSSRPSRRSTTSTSGVARHRTGHGRVARPGPRGRATR